MQKVSSSLQDDKGSKAPSGFITHRTHSTLRRSEHDWQITICIGSKPWNLSHLMVQLTSTSSQLSRRFQSICSFKLCKSLASRLNCEVLPTTSSREHMDNERHPIDKTMHNQEWVEVEKRPECSLYGDSRRRNGLVDTDCPSTVFRRP